MSKNPSDTWFYNDWENDPELKTCTLAAQGLWMRLLCIAARSPERGVVQIGSLDFSHPKGLPQIAAAVGRSPEEIAPLIDELISSGAASVDRRKRIFNRRMVKAAKTSEARAESGKIGAGVTNGKRWGKVDLGRQNVGKTSASSSLPPPNPLLINSSSTLAASASASPNGPPRPPLPDSAKWSERLAAFKPWLGERPWKPQWGLPPDSAGTNGLIPVEMMRAWKATYAAEMAKLRAAA